MRVSTTCTTDSSVCGGNATSKSQPRTHMTWSKLDNNFLEHPKFERIGPVALSVWTRCLTYCGRLGTDGRISARRVRQYADASFMALELDGLCGGVTGDTRNAVTDACVTALVTAGLLVVVADDIFEMHDYLDHQMGSKKVERTREATKARVSRHRNAARNAVTNAVSNGPVTLSEEEEKRTEEKEKQKSPNLKNPVSDPTGKAGCPDPRPVRGNSEAPQSETRDRPVNALGPVTATPAASVYQNEQDNPKEREEHPPVPRPRVDQGTAAYEREFWIEAYRLAVVDATGNAAWPFPRRQIPALTDLVANRKGDKKPIDWIRDSVTSFVNATKGEAKFYSAHGPDGLVKWLGLSDEERKAKKAGPKPFARPTPLNNQPGAGPEHKTHGHLMIEDGIVPKAQWCIFVDPKTHYVDDSGPKPVVMRKGAA